MDHIEEGRLSQLGRGASDREGMSCIRCFIEIKLKIVCAQCLRLSGYMTILLNFLLFTPLYFNSFSFADKNVILFSIRANSK